MVRRGHAQRQAGRRAARPLPQPGPRQASSSKALETLALSHDTQKKAVSLNFNGEGKRKVRVGYVVENPIWKTSYRLVLSKKKDGKPFLQGWAVVENPSDEDWKDVRMALVSGRPISFQMDLYQPLYVPRPVVEPELFASLRPPTYNGAMDEQADDSRRPGSRTAALARARARRRRPRTATARKAGSDALASQSRRQAGVRSRQRLDERHGPEQGRGVVGDGGRAGRLLPVRDRPPGDAAAAEVGAMLPIVHKDVEADARQHLQRAHPGQASRCSASSSRTPRGMHLMQGPITVFEGSSYAGDARVLDVQPKDERLISYAIDLGTEVEPVAKRQPDRLTKVKVNKGILYRTDKVREEKTYNVKNRSEHDRVVLIEHPFRPDFNLVSKDKPAEHDPRRLPLRAEGRRRQDAPARR